MSSTKVGRIDWIGIPSLPSGTTHRLVQLLLLILVLCICIVHLNCVHSHAHTEHNIPNIHEFAVVAERTETTLLTSKCIVAIHCAHTHRKLFPFCCTIFFRYFRRCRCRFVFGSSHVHTIGNEYAHTYVYVPIIRANANSTKLTTNDVLIISAFRFNISVFASVVELWLVAALVRRIYVCHSGCSCTILRKLINVRRDNNETEKKTSSFCIISIYAVARWTSCPLLLNRKLTHSVGHSVSQSSVYCNIIGERYKDRSG